MRPYFKSTKINRGFTLAELVVTMGIVVTILTVVLLNQSNYTDGAGLASLADEISVAVTQAQVYGISVRELGVGSNNFTAGYGIEFRTLAGGGADDAYIYFADIGGNRAYDSGWSCPVGGGSECLSKIAITRGNKVSSLCVVQTNNTEICSNVGRVDISFARPDTDAKIVFFDTAGGVYNPGSVKGAKIYLKSPKLLTRSVTVYTTGQVSTQ